MTFRCAIWAHSAPELDNFLLTLPLNMTISCSPCPWTWQFLAHPTHKLHYFSLTLLLNLICPTHQNLREGVWPSDTPVTEKIYGRGENLQRKLQALVQDILPATTTTIDYAMGVEKLVSWRSKTRSKHIKGDLKNLKEEWLLAFKHTKARSKHTKSSK